MKTPPIKESHANLCLFLLQRHGIVQAMAREEEPEPLAPLLKAAHDGDETALSKLLRRLWPWLRRKAGYLAGRSGSSLSASSLAQESALRLSRSIGDTKAADVPAVKALLTRIMANTAESARRSAKRIKRSAVPLSAEDLMTVPVRGDVSFEQREHEQLLLAAIERLPDPQKQALLLLRSGASYTEIAEQCGCSINAVYMRLQRAKEQLADVSHAPARPSRHDGR